MVSLYQKGLNLCCRMCMQVEQLIEYAQHLYRMIMNKIKVKAESTEFEIFISIEIPAKVPNPLLVVCPMLFLCSLLMFKSDTLE